MANNTGLASLASPWGRSSSWPDSLSRSLRSSKHRRNKILQCAARRQVSHIMSIFESIILAIIEGVTEFLPVSSTGHLIIGSSLMGIADDPFTKMFTVAIQLGAILSVVVLYWKR